MHGFDDYRHSFEKEERRGLLWHLPQSNSLDRKLSKRTLKNCNKNTEVWVSTAGGFWCAYRCGRTQFSLGTGHLEFDRAPESIRATQIKLSPSFFSLFFRGSDKGEGWAREGWEVSVVGVHDVKIQ